MLLYGQDQKQGQGAHHDEQDQPPGGGDFLLRASPVNGVADHLEKFQYHFFDVRPIGGKYRCQSAQMEQHVKEYVVSALHTQAEKILGNGQVAGAGNGQKFCNTLDKSQEQSVQQGHGEASLYNISSYDSTTVCDFPYFFADVFHPGKNYEIYERDIDKSRSSC